MVTFKLNPLQGLQGRKRIESVASGPEFSLQPQPAWGRTSAGGGPTPWRCDTPMDMDVNKLETGGGQGRCAGCRVLYILLFVMHGGYKFVQSE